MATRADRFGAYFLDFFAAWLIAAPVFAVLEESTLRTVLARSLVVAYLLVRDTWGASLGKLALGFRVVGERPLGANAGGRILRNVTLVAPLVVGILGESFEFDVGLIAIAASLLFLVDVFFLLQQGRRLGDIIAGTSVVHRR